MVKLYKSNQKDIVKLIEETLRKETGQKIFTLRVMDMPEEDKVENVIEVLVVFENKKILMSRFVILTTNGEIVLRMQGNYI